MGSRARVPFIVASVLVLAVASTATALLHEPAVDDPTDPGGFDAGALFDRFAIEITVGLGLAGLGALLYFGLGTRHVTAENVLDHDGRAQIYETIQEDPGIHLRELARDQDMNITAAAWHLKKLEDVGLVRSRKTEGYKVFYDSSGGRATQNLGVARNALKNDNARTILATIVDDPGNHQRGIAEEIDLNHATVRWHLEKLVDADLIVKVPTGYRTRYYISAQGLHAMQALGNGAS